MVMVDSSYWVKVIISLLFLEISYDFVIDERKFLLFNVKKQMYLVRNMLYRTRIRKSKNWLSHEIKRSNLIISHVKHNILSTWLKIEMLISLSEFQVYEIFSKKFLDFQFFLVSVNAEFKRFDTCNNKRMRYGDECTICLVILLITIKYILYTK